jgi:hypothetical protein
VTCQRFSVTLSPKPQKFPATLTQQKQKFAATLTPNTQRFSVTLSPKPSHQATISPKPQKFTTTLRTGRPGPPGPPGPAEWALERLSGEQNGVNKIFTATNPIEVGTEMVLINGLTQTHPDHYDLSGRAVTFDEAPEPDDILQILYAEAT